MSLAVPYWANFPQGSSLKTTTINVAYIPLCEPVQCLGRQEVSGMSLRETSSDRPKQLVHLPLLSNPLVIPASLSPKSGLWHSWPLKPLRCFARALT